MHLCLRYYEKLYAFLAVKKQDHGLTINNIDRSLPIKLGELLVFFFVFFIGCHQ